MIIQGDIESLRTQNVEDFKSFGALSPLLLAVLHEQEAVLDYLLQLNFLDVNLPDPEEGLTPLHLACHLENLNMISSLLEARADPNVLTLNGESALWFAASSGSINSIALLWRKGAKIDVQVEGDTPVMLATREDNLEVLTQLVMLKADLTKKNEQNLTVTELAASLGRFKLLKFLLINNGDISDTFLQRSAAPFTNGAWPDPIIRDRLVTIKKQAEYFRYVRGLNFFSFFKLEVPVFFTNPPRLSSVLLENTE